MSTPELDHLFAAYGSGHGPGCIVGVAREGETIYRQAFGHANVEHGVANSLTTRMPIASVTKHFTCAAALALQAEGRLSIDDRVGRWLPDLPSAQKRVTLRQLMNHTGGVRCYLDHGIFNGYATIPVGMPERIQRRQNQPNFEPGQGSSYSNGGYLLLSMVIARAAGQSLSEVLRTRFFEPLGLHATSLPEQRWPAQQALATTYLPMQGDVPSGWRHGLALTDELFGDGGMVSTVDDLLRWAAHLRACSGPVSFETLAGSTHELEPGESAYGFGLIRENWRGIEIVHHAGGLPGASSTFLRVPSADIEIAVLCNRPAPAVELSLRILEILLQDRLQPEMPAPGANEHAALIGDFLCEQTGMLLGFADMEGKLGLSLFGRPPFPLSSVPQRGDALPFGADVGTGIMRFRASLDGGANDAIEYSDGGTWFVAERVRGERIPARDASLRRGEYYSVSAAATLRFDVEGDSLYVITSGEYGGGRYPAEFITPHLVRFWPTLFPGGMLIRLHRVDGVIDRLIVSTARTREIVFERSPGRM